MEKRSLHIVCALVAHAEDQAFCLSISSFGENAVSDESRTLHSFIRRIVIDGYDFMRNVLKDEPNA
jgi:hypothetical protein